MSAALLALGAAAVLAVASSFTKRLVGAFPHRQLGGPLLLLNAALVSPLAAVSAWRLDGSIVALHLVSVAAQVIGTFAVLELFAEGSAAAVAVAQAMAPMPALAFALMLLSASVGWLQAGGAIIVSAGLLIVLAPAFEALSRRRAIFLVVLAAIANGLVIVLTKLLADRGVGVGEIYVTRTLLAGIAIMVLVPPRAIPGRALPALALRAALQSSYFVLLILAVERGSPVTVQMLGATTPLFLVGGAVLARREPPSPRVTLAAAAVVAGVALAVA
jgi:drug/metabolite transporter (DMT)-like permease